MQQAEPDPPPAHDPRAAGHDLFDRLWAATFLWRALTFIAAAVAGLLILILWILMGQPK